ncbi:NAD(P)/FAD-dependent oxidoreductase [Desulfogranum japonicum]|uniref:NAD(P)/FAD-dependent oxidoreductase n=1 Tax=Desulfogranum japonicum TaxID=231447 RepID=UPI00048F4DAC|nr:NAD(P)/FAD-dependent oxidoreductase [Desulfogranum japonicum]
MSPIQEHVDILIIGGGPAGLSCAYELALQNKQVLLLERKETIGEKVCAGGITWSGLLQHVPENLVEQSFPEQTIVTTLQQCKIRETNPIIATVNRVRLGQWMAKKALNSGAHIASGVKVLSISDKHVTLLNREQQVKTIRFNHLIGADGANSLVRRFLKLPNEKMGLGLNADLAIHRQQMQWHFNPRLFANGYAWIFPHKETCSVGAYVQSGSIPARELKKHLIKWTGAQQLHIPSNMIKAGLVNYDYRGHCFGRFWLIGEAAGLASGLTGEGIYPAIVSGCEVARAIADPTYKTARIDLMVNKQRRHNKMLKYSSKYPWSCQLMINFIVLCMRMKLIPFQELEMAD